jgi:hypothetical protein
MAFSHASTIRALPECAKSLIRIKTAYSNKLLLPFYPEKKALQLLKSIWPPNNTNISSLQVAGLLFSEIAPNLKLLFYRLIADPNEYIPVHWRKHLEICSKIIAAYYYSLYCSGLPKRCHHTHMIIRLLPTQSVADQHPYPDVSFDDILGRVL